MTLSNVGSGPARIAWFHVVDAQGVSYSGGSLYERVAQVEPKASFTSEQISGTLLRSGGERSVFRWPKPVGSEIALADWTKLNRARFALQASACYCSMFDECRVTTFGETHPKPVPSCEATTQDGQSAAAPAR